MDPVFSGTHPFVETPNILTRFHDNTLVLNAPQSCANQHKMLFKTSQTRFI